MMFVRYVSESGTDEWERLVVPGLLGLSAIAAADGGYVVAGQTGFYDPSVGVQGFVVKLDKDGYPEWQQEIGEADSIRRLQPFHGETVFDGGSTALTSRARKYSSRH